MTDNDLPVLGEDLLAWLLTGDVSIQYQVCRDLLYDENPSLRNRMQHEGWGAVIMARRENSGHWGRKYYQPKWICTHYTLLELKDLAFPQDHPAIGETIRVVLDTCKGTDGGINPHVTIPSSELCVSGMFLNAACYFHAPEESLKSIVDFILSHRMGDGGFNCVCTVHQVRHSSLHTTICIAEGIASYLKHGYRYRAGELREAEDSAWEFMLAHRLYRSDRSGEVIDHHMIRPRFPCRWRYDVLRALECARESERHYDERMDDALQLLASLRRPDGRWLLYAGMPGKVHQVMEPPGRPSRWNTLRSLRVLSYYAV